MIPIWSFPRSAPNPIGFDIPFSCGELAWLSFSYLVNEPRDRSTARMHDCDVIYTDRLVTDRWAYVAHRAFMWRLLCGVLGARRSQPFWARHPASIAWQTLAYLA